MIRLIQRRLIIPRGDTGSFSIPVLKDIADNIAVFTIFDEVSHTKILQRKVKSEGGLINIAFTHADTVNLKPGEYVWDIKYYSNPEYIDDELVNGEEIDSYYAGFSLPVCEIRETADNYLVSPEGPTATLSPEQLEIVTGAIHSLNEAIRKTQENVEHYPEIRDEVWYVWDAELGDYVSTDVRANGIVGNGIASAVLNDDYTLTLNFTDGTSFTSPSIRGQRGNGIEDIVLNNDFTLTITYTDGESYITPSIRGPVGATPQFSIGTVQDGAVAAASITGTAENPVLNLTLPNAHVPTRVSQLENDSNYAVDANYVHTDNNYTTAEKEKLSGIAAGAEVNVNADWNANSGDAQILNKPTKVSDFTNDAGYLTEHQDISGKADKSEIPTKVSQLQNDSGYLTSYAETDPTVPAWAKAATKPSYTAAEVGALPSDTHIPSTTAELTNDAGFITVEDIPEVPVQDVQVNGTSILDAQGVANVPVGANSTLGLVMPNVETGVFSDATGKLYISKASDAQIKSGANVYRAISSNKTDLVSFYGLAKAAGADMKDIANTTVGQYPDAQKEAIQSMLGITQMLAPTNPNLVATQAYSIGDVFAANGHLYKATAAIAQDGAIIPDTNCAETTMVDESVRDVQIDGTSIAANGVAEIPIASTTNPGVILISGHGLQMRTESGKTFISTEPVSNAYLKTGGNVWNPITSDKQHISTFYGLAKVAGHDEKNSTESVGTYTPEAKGAIQQMLGVSDLIATAENDLVASKAYAIGDVFTANGKLYKATAAIAADAAIITDGANANCEETNIGEEFPHDVQVNGVSVVQNGVANVPAVGFGTYGVVKIANGTYGLNLGSVDNSLIISRASETEIKSGWNGYKPITPYSQHIATFYGLAKAAGDTTQSQSSTAVGQYTDTAKAAIRSMLGATSSNVIAVQDTQPTDADTKIWLPETAGTPVEVPTVAEMNAALSEKVGDVQVNGSSVVSNGVANVPLATASSVGVVRTSTDRGTSMQSNTILGINPATDAQIKAGTQVYCPVAPYRQHQATFYGLAKAAGDTTQSQSSNAVGTYTNEAKVAIQTMLGIDLSSIASQVEIPLVETVEGAAVTITGQPNTRYMCGEVTSISITPPAAGSIDVVFTSGSTVAVLTLPSTVKMPEWFDATTLDANTVYEILITDGVYGSVMTWAT